MIKVGLIEFWSLGLGKIYEAWSNRHDGKISIKTPIDKTSLDITKVYKVGQMTTQDDIQSQIQGPPVTKQSNI